MNPQLQLNTSASLQIAKQKQQLSEKGGKTIYLHVNKGTKNTVFYQEVTHKFKELKKD